MTMWRSRLVAFGWRFGLFVCCNLFDAVVLFQGLGVRLQTALIVVYRLVLYSPSSGDLAMFLLFGFFWDALYNVPIGFHGFLLLVVFVILNSQKRYLQVNHQYMRWLLFLGVLIFVNLIEYAMHFLIGQQIVLSFRVMLSIVLTFSFYPFFFKFLQHYDR